MLICVTVLAGCVSSQPPQAVDQTKESRVADDPAAMSRIGDVAAAHGERETEVTFYRRAAELRPDDPEAQLSYARALVAAGRANDAVDVLRLTFQKAPDNSSVADSFGKLLLSEHKPREAAVIFDEGRHSHPQDAALQIGLGVSLDDTCRHTAAQSAYREALADEPDSVAARNDLGLSMVLAGDYDAAVKILSPLRAELVASGRSTEAASVGGNLALAYALMGNASAAARINSQVLPQDQVLNNARFYDLLRTSGSQGCGDDVAVPALPS